MSKKGKIISISVIVVLIVSLLVCIFAVMTVRSTKVNFLYKTDINESQVVSALDKSGAIPYGKSLVFVNKQEVQQNIEKAYPKLKVHNIEYEFPSVVKINCIERVGVFCVSDSVSGKTFVVDSELKVIEEASQAQKESLITLSFDNVDGYQTVALGSVKLAEYLNFDYLLNCSKLFTFVQKQVELNHFIKLFDKISVVQGYNNRDNNSKIEKLIFHTTNSSKQIIFENVCYNMEQRFATLYDVAISPEKYSSDIIELAY